MRFFALSLSRCSLSTHEFNKMLSTGKSTMIFLHLVIFLSFFACFICYSNVIFVDISITFLSRKKILRFKERCRFNRKIEIKINAGRFSACFPRRYGWKTALSACKIGKVLSQPDLLLVIYGQNIQSESFIGRQVNCRVC